MLDEKDKMILESLFRNGRLTTKELAREAKITQPAAYKRLQKLEKEQYIQRYDSIINWEAFPCIKKAYFCNDVDLEKIQKQACCFAIHEIIGEYRYVIWSFFKNRQMQRSFEATLPRDTKSAVIKKLEWTGMSIFDIPVKVKQENFIFQQQKLNKQDVKLLQVLSEGGARKTIKELADDTGLSMDVVWQHKKKLIKNGYFMHFLAQPGDFKLGLTLTYIFFDTKESMAKIPKRCLITFKTSTGYAVAIITSSHTDYLEAIESIFSQFKHPVKDSLILSVKKAHLLNRYPFGFLLDVT